MGVGSSEVLLTQVGHQFAVVASWQGVRRAVRDGVAVNERAEQALLPMLDGCPRLLPLARVLRGATSP